MEEDFYGSWNHWSPRNIFQYSKQVEAVKYSEHIHWSVYNVYIHGIHDIHWYTWHDHVTLHVSRNSHMSPWRWGQDLNTTIIIPVRATRPFSRGVLFSAEVIDFLFFPTYQVRVCRFYERCCLPPPASTSTFSAFASTASSRAERGQCRTSTASSRFQ